MSLFENQNQSFEQLRRDLEGDGEVDLITAYSTDGRIASFDLEVLRELPDPIPDVSSRFPGRSGSAARLSSLFAHLGLPRRGRAVVEDEPTQRRLRRSRKGASTAASMYAVSERGAELIGRVVYAELDDPEAMAAIAAMLSEFQAAALNLADSTPVKTSRYQRKLAPPHTVIDGESLKL